MSKVEYKVDLANTHSGFMEKYEVDLIITTIGVLLALQRKGPQRSGRWE